MTIEIGYFFNDVCGATSNSWAGIVFSNIIYTSILVAILILIIICFTYPTKKGTPMYITFKLMFYVFAVVLGVLAVYERLTETRLENKYSSKMNKEIMQAIRGGSINEVIGSNHVKISPKYKEEMPKESYREDNLGRNDIINEDSEKILSHVLNGDTQFGGDLGDYKKQEMHSDYSDTIKVAGASVEDMLTELGV